MFDLPLRKCLCHVNPSRAYEIVIGHNPDVPKFSSLCFNASSANLKTYFHLTWGDEHTVQHTGDVL